MPSRQVLMKGDRSSTAHIPVGSLRTDSNCTLRAERTIAPPKRIGRSFMLGFLENAERDLHGKPQFHVQGSQLQSLPDRTEGREVGLGVHDDQAAHLLEKP